MRILAPVRMLAFALGLLCAAWLTLTPSTAAASTALLLPRIGGSGVGPAERERARAALEQVFVNDGWTVHTPDEIGGGLPGHLAACSPDVACAVELRALTGVDVTVGLRLWGTEDRVEHLAVLILGERGVAQRGLAEVNGATPLEFAVADAARAAARAWRGGPRARRASGAGELLADDQALAPSDVNWAIGGLLALGSVPLLGYGINTAVRDGDCVTTGIGGACVERVRFREGAGIFTGLGVALLIGAGIVWATQPIRVLVAVDHESAGLHVTGRF